MHHTVKLIYYPRASDVAAKNRRERRVIQLRFLFGEHKDQTRKRELCARRHALFDTAWSSYARSKSDMPLRSFPPLQAAKGLVASSAFLTEKLEAYAASKGFADDVEVATLCKTKKLDLGLDNKYAFSWAARHCTAFCLSCSYLLSSLFPLLSSTSSD